MCHHPSSQHPQHQHPAGLGARRRSRVRATLAGSVEANDARSCPAGPTHPQRRPHTPTTPAPHQKHRPVDHRHTTTSRVVDDQPNTTPTTTPPKQATPPAQTTCPPNHHNTNPPRQIDDTEPTRTPSADLARNHLELPPERTERTNNESPHPVTPATANQVLSPRTGAEPVKQPSSRSNQ